MEINKQIQLRGGFSDRNKIKPLNMEMQLTEFDQRTRIAFINLIKQWYDDEWFDNYKYSFYENLLSNVFSIYISDDVIYEIENEENKLFNTYIYDIIINQSSSYDDILTLLEYIVNCFKEAERNEPYNALFPFRQNKDYTQEINSLFIKECVGYRMIDNQIIPITDKIEFEEIQQAIKNKFEGSKNHLKKAISFLYDKEKPDYKNSIKESISAVESICKIIINNDNTTLGKALNKLEESGIKIHKSLKSAFSSLYGYSSNEGGIRHSEGMLESNVSFDDAKYMLVTCSAFINYLIPKINSIDNK